MKLSLALLLAAIALTSPAFAEQKKEACAGVVELVKQTQVVMKQEREWREVYVNKSWEGLTIDQKKNLITVIAKCLQKNQAVTVFDGYSGKRLASYGPLWGFKVE